MAKGSGTDDLVSLNERKFVVDAIARDKRLDGRGLFDFRPLRVAFAGLPGRVHIQLGSSKVYVVTTAEVVAPYPSHPTEGFFKFEIEFSPMASPVYDGGRPTASAIELQRVVERGLRESGAIDTEALCIIAGQRVWSIRLDIHVLDDDGNLTDCCSVGAIAALHHFRRPDVTISGDNVTIHPPKEKELVPLSIHHIPVCITFAIFPGPKLVVDPNWKEEQIMSGSMTMTLNAQHEICAMQKAGGLALAVPEIIKATKIATTKATEVIQIIQQALKDDKAKKPIGDPIQSGIGLYQKDKAEKLVFSEGAQSIDLDNAGADAIKYEQPNAKELEDDDMDQDDDFPGDEERKEFAQFAEKMKQDLASASSGEAVNVSSAEEDDDVMEVSAPQKVAPKVQVTPGKPKQSPAKRPQKQDDEDTGRASAVGKPKKAFPIVKKAK